MPVFLENPSEPLVRKDDSSPRTNPYSEDSLRIIERCRDGIVLDFGAGFPPETNRFDHVVQLDCVCYPSTDIVSTCPVFPFQDESFDALICESVLEHLPDPFRFARESFRVLKAGGLIRVDTAFLQPYHQDPEHYFNMTLSGIRRVFQDFEEIEAGVANYQRASYAVELILKAYGRCVPEERVKERIEALLAMSLHELDNRIDRFCHQALAAGVFFFGRKPGS